MVKSRYFKFGKEPRTIVDGVWNQECHFEHYERHFFMTSLENQKMIIDSMLPYVQRPDAEPCLRAAIDIVFCELYLIIMTKEEAFDRLEKSKFRSRFRLSEKDLAYIEKVGLDTVKRHAEDFVRIKLADADPLNDGKQTPMKGHPVFLAMHATAMCCRGCMEKWWKVAKHRPLTALQQERAVGMIMEWISRQTPKSLF